jgi:hypothetical protein
MWSIAQLGEITDHKEEGIEFTGAIHPVAAMFPMMSDEELDDLAADIKAHGLIHPIVLDEEGTLIDGRNRLEACHRARVTPSYTTLDGRDPVMYILSSNVARRHMSKGQTAMAVAQANFFAAKKFGDQQVLARAVGVSDAGLSKANTVREYAPDLADGVLTGSPSLDAAYDEARQRKIAAEVGRELLEKLRGSAPDLADRVVDGELSVREAWDMAERREQERLSRVRIATGNLRQGLELLAPVNPVTDYPSYLEEWRPYWDLSQIDPPLVTRTIEFLTALKGELPQ